MRGLQAYCDNCRHEWKEEDEMVFLHVANLQTVQVLSQPTGRSRQRTIYLEAICKSPAVEKISKTWEQWMCVENLLIALRWGYQKGGDRDALQALLGGISASSELAISDDGVSQRVSRQSGVALKQWDDLAREFKLSPYVTFPEVEQPTVPFGLRARKYEDDIQVMLIRMDGGLVKSLGEQAVVDWLADNVPDMVIV